MIGLNIGKNSSVALPPFISEKRIIFKGAESRDPELIFYNPQSKSMTKDFHPMRGITNNAPLDNAWNNNILRSSIRLGVVCPAKYNKQFGDFLTQLNCKQSVNYNVDYVIPFPSFANC